METIKLTDTAARVSRIDENQGVWTVELEWGGPEDRTIDDFDLYKICDISDANASWGTIGRTGWMVILTRPKVTVGDSIPLAVNGCKTATAWADAMFGLSGWSPQTADEFIFHCLECGLKITVGLDENGEPILAQADHSNVSESGGKIWVRHAATRFEPGFAPVMNSGFALVAE